MAENKKNEIFNELDINNLIKQDETTKKTSVLNLKLVRDLILRAAYYNRLGMSYHARGDTDIALKQFKKALTIAEKLGDLKKKIVYLSNIGAIYKLQGQDKEAIKIFELVIDTADKLEDLIVKATFLNRVGLIYHDLGSKLKSEEDYSEALKYFKKAMYNYEEALRIAELSDELKMKSTIINNIAGIYNAQGNFPKALIRYQKALDILEELGLRESADAQKIQRNIYSLKNIINKRKI